MLRLFSKIVILCISFCFVYSNINPCFAGKLEARIKEYPSWTNKPSLSTEKNDLYYPDWIKGTWQVSNVLIEKKAPLAPKVITPGFEVNDDYLQKKVYFQVRFREKNLLTSKNSLIPQIANVEKFVVADRIFNGTNIAKAYLGEDQVSLVKLDPKNPNRQIIFLPQNGKLISTITGRSTEQPSQKKFITTELTQQIFDRLSGIYINEVETTTFYKLINKDKIEADQISAIYLSPQDPNYFKAINKPVALYKYELILTKVKDNLSVDNNQNNI